MDHSSSETTGPIELPYAPMRQGVARTPEGAAYTPLLHNMLPDGKMESFLLQGIEKAKESVWIASAYYDLKTLEKIGEALKKNPNAAHLRKTLIISEVRGCFHATEEEKAKGIKGIADTAEEMGFELKILPPLHAKVYCIDQQNPGNAHALREMQQWALSGTLGNVPRSVEEFCELTGHAGRVISGSGNATQRGMHRNIEFNVAELDIGERGREWMQWCDGLAFPVTTPEVKSYLAANDSIRRSATGTNKHQATALERHHKDFLNYAYGHWDKQDAPEEWKKVPLPLAENSRPAPIAPTDPSEELLRLYSQLGLLKLSAEESGNPYYAAAYNGISKHLLSASALTPPPERLGVSLKLPMNSGENEFLAALAAGVRKNVLILTPLQQSADKLKDMCKFLARGVPVHVIHSNSAPDKSYSADHPGIVIANYQGIEGLIAQGVIRPEAFDTLINHGLHTDSISQENLEAVAQQFTNARLVVDHSATGEFMSQGRKRAFLPTLKEAVEDFGVLASTRSIIVKNGVGQVDEAKDLTRDVMAKLSSDPKRTDMLVKFHANYVDEESGLALHDQKAVVHCYDIDHAKDVADKFNEAFGEGTAAALHSNLSESAQRDLVNRFKEGKIKVLTNVGMAQHIDDPSCSVCYNFVPSRSAALIEKQSQIVMQQPHTEEEAQRLRQYQPGAKQAFVVDFYNEGIQGQVFFAGVAQAGALSSSGKPPAHPHEPKESSPRKKSDYLPDHVEIVSEISQVMALTQQLDKEQREQHDLQTNHLNARRFSDAVKARIATDEAQGPESVASDLVTTTTADYFNAVGSALKNAQFDPEDENYIKVEFNGYRGRFPLDAGLHRHGFQMQREHLDFAATELGKILEKRRGFIADATPLAALRSDIDALPAAAYEAGQSVLSDTIRKLRMKKNITLGDTSLTPADILVIRNPRAETEPYIFLSPGATHALHGQLQQLASQHVTELKRWNNPGKELSPPMSLYDALPHRAPSTPEHLRKKHQKLHMFTTGAEVVIAEDGVIGIPRGEGYANNWRIKLPAQEDDIKALQARITQRQQVIAKELEPELVETFDKPLALQALLGKIPEQQALALQALSFDEALDVIVEKHLLAGDTATIAAEALAEIEHAPDYMDKRRESRLVLRARDYAKQYQENMAYAEAMLIDHLVWQYIAQCNPSMEIPSKTGHGAVTALRNDPDMLDHPGLIDLDTDEKMYKQYRETVMEEYEDDIIDFRKRMLVESLGVSCSNHIPHEDADALADAVSSVSDLLHPKITEALVPHCVAAMKRLNGSGLSAAIHDYEHELASKYFHMDTTAMSRAFEHEARDWRTTLQYVESPERFTKEHGKLVELPRSPREKQDHASKYMFDLMNHIIKQEGITVSTLPASLLDDHITALPTLAMKAQFNNILSRHLERGETATDTLGVKDATSLARHTVFVNSIPLSDLNITRQEDKGKKIGNLPADRAYSDPEFLATASAFYKKIQALFAAKERPGLLPKYPDARVPNMEYPISMGLNNDAMIDLSQFLALNEVLLSQNSELLKKLSSEGVDIDTYNDQVVRKIIPKDNAAFYPALQTFMHAVENELKKDKTFSTDPHAIMQDDDEPVDSDTLSTFMNACLKSLGDKDRETIRKIMALFVPDIDVVQALDRSLERASQQDEYGLRRFHPYAEMELVSAQKGRSKKTD